MSESFDLVRSEASAIVYRDRGSSQLALVSGMPMSAPVHELVTFLDPTELQRGEIHARVVGSLGLMYDQFGTDKGGVFLLDNRRCTTLSEPIRNGDTVVFFQNSPNAYQIINRARKGALEEVTRSYRLTDTFPFVEGAVLIPSRAGLRTRIHSVGTGDSLFVYGEGEEGLVAVLDRTSQSMDGISLTGSAKAVKGQWVSIKPGVTVPTYNVELPKYEGGNVHVDYMHFETDQMVASVQLDEIDGGIRERMKSLGAKSVSVFWFYDLGLRIFKQVVVYHELKPGMFDEFNLPCFCLKPREEFLIGAPKKNLLGGASA